MKSLFPEIKLTVEKTVTRSGFTLSAILRKLGIQRSWYYRKLNHEPVLDGRFNAFSITFEEWIVPIPHFLHRSDICIVPLNPSITIFIFSSWLSCL